MNFSTNTDTADNRDTAMEFEPGSFRDRTSRVMHHRETIYRVLNNQALNNWKVIENTNFFKRFTHDNKIVKTQLVKNKKLLPTSHGEQLWAGMLMHETIPFISYCYEWTFGMLKDAALLQLDILSAALDEDIILKDSSAYNFQWIGSVPIFIDIPSFEPHQDDQPWIGYRQFCQMFLNPLMLQAYKHFDFHPLMRGNIDGIDIHQVFKLISKFDLFKPGVFLHVYMHAKMQDHYSYSQKNVKTALTSAGFGKELIKNNVRKLYKLIQGLKWNPPKSEWSNYQVHNSYNDIDLDIKKSFVQEVVDQHPRKLVWDIGCNTGLFSIIAAKNSSYVISMDRDHLAMEKFYQLLKEKSNTKILPLVMNITDPSSGLGWRCRERKALIDRGKPDLILCLALIHHIVISSHVPLEEFLKWLANTGNELIIEFITKDDPMVKTLLLNKKDNYYDYEQDYFEQALEKYFTIKKKITLQSETRTLYHADKK
jgi:SAM-dependent methyltransferase